MMYQFMSVCFTMWYVNEGEGASSLAFYPCHTLVGSLCKSEFLESLVLSIFIKFLCS